MITIVQLNADELRVELKNIFRESIDEIKKLPTPAPLPDRLTLNEACELTGQSKSQVYKLTMQGEIPFQKFGRKLVFSRKALLQWIEDRTTSSSSTEDEISNKLAATGRKRLKK